MGEEKVRYVMNNPKPGTPVMFDATEDCLTLYMNEGDPLIGVLLAITSEPEVFKELHEDMLKELRCKDV